MHYFPLFSFYWPDWIPWIGGERFEFFRPVFNIADIGITVGAILLVAYFIWFDKEDKNADVKN